jgi:hypothetical protein
MASEVSPKAQLNTEHSQVEWKAPSVAEVLWAIFKYGWRL